MYHLSQRDEWLTRVYPHVQLCAMVCSQIMGVGTRTKTLQSVGNGEWYRYRFFACCNTDDDPRGCGLDWSNVGGYPVYDCRLYTNDFELQIMIPAQYIAEAIEIAIQADIYAELTIEKACKYAAMLQRMGTGEFDRNFDEYRDEQAQGQ